MLSSLGLMHFYDGAGKMRDVGYVVERSDRHLIENIWAEYLGD
jgi:hypothetical protein